jgi:hypothetical protein
MIARRARLTMEAAPLIASAGRQTLYQQNEIRRLALRQGN